MRFVFTVVLTVLVVSGLASASAEDKPGPMQSGSHATATGTAGKPSGAAVAVDQNFDVNKLFANTCGWCHSEGGRKAGKGPKLMGTALTDPEIVSRIKNGKIGQMPAFGSAFSEAQIKAIVEYIRNLKPES